MRLSIVTLAVAVLPTMVAAQVRQPRRPLLPPPTTTTTELPPQAPIVSHALDYQRARWAVDAYTLIATYASPTGFGATSQYTSAGTGTRADYRISAHFSATADVTSTYLFSPSVVFTGEAGSRYWSTSRESELRPYVDLRAVYLRASDQLDGRVAAPGGPNPYGYDTYSRYSQGVGALVGAGVERTINNSFSITTGLAAVRAAMNAYRLEPAAQLPDHAHYWTTSMRFLLGISYNRTSMTRSGGAAKSLR
jgi:hypothetical protein